MQVCNKPKEAADNDFPHLNQGYNSVFQVGRLSVGLVVPIEAYPYRSQPTMADHFERVKLAEQLGFAAVWLRDVPFDVPSFRDAGQLFDPFVYLGALASQTSEIALGVASIVLPLRHPAHVAKAAATVDQLSNGRVILGIASGDRPEEYPALNIPFGHRDQLFRESYDYIRAMAADLPNFENSFGSVAKGLSMLPKPTSGRLPLLITGSSRQSLDWIVDNSDGWMTYPEPEPRQKMLIETFRTAIKEAGLTNKPILEPLYLDLANDPNQPATAIHLGIRVGSKGLVNYLKSRRDLGVNHIALNLRFNNNDPVDTINRLSQQVLPEFTK